MCIFSICTTSPHTWPIYAYLRSSCASLESDDSEGTSSEQPEESGTWDMSFTLNRLESFHDLKTNEPEGKSKYAKNGMDKKRIKLVSRNAGCDCKCSVPPGLLFRICCAFWALPKCAQDALLWSVQTEGGRKQINYFIEGPLSFC